MPKPRPKDLLAFAAEKASIIPVFRTTDRASNDIRFEWAGESPQEFVNLATKAGARLLYLRTFAEDSGHGDEPALAELAFQCEGLFHCFRTVAPWANEEVVLAADDGLDEISDTSEEDDGVGEEEVLAADDSSDETGDASEEDDDVSDVVRDEYGEANDAELAANLSADEEAVVAAFTEHFMKSDDHVSTDLCSVQSELEGYLVDTRGCPAGLSWDLPKYTRVVERISRRVAKAIREREKDLIEGLANECVSWARSSGVKTLSQGDIELFLLETNRPLSYESMRLLTQKAKFELKARR